MREIDVRVRQRERERREKRLGDSYDVSLASAFGLFVTQRGEIYRRMRERKGQPFFFFFSPSS